MGNFVSASESLVVDRSRLADQILKDLKEQILSGRLPTGSKLPSEKEIAARYRVAGSTVREAIRGLTAMGLAGVRHGKGGYVTADPHAIVARSLGAVIQLEGPGVVEVLGVLGMLNEQAARLASKAGTEQDHARLQAALDDLNAADTATAIAPAVRNFHRAIAMAAHNSLLGALCGFLVDVQAELGRELSEGPAGQERHIFHKLKSIRSDLVAAIVRRDEEMAGAMARAFHFKVSELIMSLPKAKTVRLTDPELVGLLSSMMSRISSV